MVTLRDGTVVDESVDAVHLTRAADVPGVFLQGPRVVSSITIHWWGKGAQGQPLTRDTYDMNMNYLASDNDRSSSTHYIAMAKRANCLVTPDDAAWHAGSAIGNTTSVGIECCPEGTDGDYETVAALIAFVRGLYGDVPLVPHNHWIGTDCPGNWDLGRLDALARQGETHPVAPVAVPTPTPHPPNAVPIQRGDNEIHWVVDRGNTLSSIAAYYGIPNDAARIAAYNGIGVNAILSIGEKIWIPGPLVWNIEAPDTIRSVAAYYGLDPSYLASLNGLNGPDDTIYIGNQLVIEH